jgi:PucR-like helix-turn-helix protein/purine catabolism regulatory family protein/diguanylate cyclase with GGDEF domain
VQLRDLIGHSPLGLELVTPEARVDRVVKGAHAIDLVRPAPWIGSGYVVLTTGIALRGSAGRQREFVHSVADADATALGFGVDVVFKNVPRPMLDAAHERHLPVFNVPFEVPFRDIIRFVTASTLDDEAAQLARVIAIQDDLLGVLERAAGEQELVDRLGVLLDARVALFDADGRVVAVANHPPLKELWELAASGVPAASLGNRSYAVAREVGVGARTEGFLAVVVRSGARESVARQVVAFAARILQALAATRLATLDAEQAVRAAVLHDLVDAERVDAALAERLQRVGLDGREPLHAIAARDAGEAGVAVRTLVDSTLARTASARLVEAVGGTVVGVWQGGAAAEDLAELVAASRSLAAGASRPVDDPTRLVHALAEARACLAAASRGATPSERFVPAESLTLADALLVSRRADEPDRVDETLEPLTHERPELLQTLVAYFEHDLDIVACARAMHLHPNSLRYRLAKIESRLGRSLRSPGTIADLYLALRARSLPGGYSDGPT